MAIKKGPGPVPIIAFILGIIVGILWMKYFNTPAVATPEAPATTAPAGALDAGPGRQ